MSIFLQHLDKLPQLLYPSLQANEAAGLLICSPLYRFDSYWPRLCWHLAEEEDKEDEEEKEESVVLVIVSILIGPI